MSVLNDLITHNEIKPIIDELYKVAGFHGEANGYMKQHSDGDFTAEFWEIYDANDDEVDDELSEKIGLVFSEACWDHMLDLVDKYPELIDLDVTVRF